MSNARFIKSAIAGHSNRRAREYELKGTKITEMDFPQVQAAIKEICPDADQAQRALLALLPELSSKFGCNGDAEAWGLLGNIAPQVIAGMSGLGIPTSQLLKDRAKRQQYTSGPSAAVEIVPTDDAEKLRYLLGKEGFEVFFTHFRSSANSLPPLTRLFSMSKI